MQSRRTSAADIDTDAFTRSGEQLNGTLPASACDRLRELLADEQGEIRWSLRGARRRRPEGGSEGHLELTLGGTLRLPCVRCLEPLEATLDETRRYRLALTEAQAERDDVDSEDFDVIAGGQHFDVLSLVEDEAIMALPLAPSHATCGLPVEVPQTHGEAGSSEEAPPQRPNPFAALEQLKRGSGRSDS